VTDSPNVELVRSIFADWERGDYSSTHWAHPEIETVFADGPAPGRWTGLAGMVEGWRDTANAWANYRNEAEEFRELDDRSVLVLSRATARGKRSGLEVGTKGAALFQVRGGKVTRVVRYWDREHALADLGLAPHGDTS
jgi:ketosteroid isomerase-like protein